MIRWFHQKLLGQEATPAPIALPAPAEPAPPEARGPALAASMLDLGAEAARGASGPHREALLEALERFAAASAGPAPRELDAPGEVAETPLSVADRRRFEVSEDAAEIAAVRHRERRVERGALGELPARPATPVGRLLVATGALGLVLTITIYTTMVGGLLGDATKELGLSFGFACLCAGAFTGLEWFSASQARQGAPYRGGPGLAVALLAAVALGLGRLVHSQETAALLQAGMFTLLELAFLLLVHEAARSFSAARMVYEERRLFWASAVAQEGLAHEEVEAIEARRSAEATRQAAQLEALEARRAAEAARAHDRELARAAAALGFWRAVSLEGEDEAMLNK